MVAGVEMSNMVKSQIMSIPTPSSRLPDFEKPKICDGRVTGGLSIHSTHVQTSKWPVDGAFSNAQLTLDSLTTCTLQLCIYVYWMYIVCIYIYIYIPINKTENIKPVNESSSLHLRNTKDQMCRRKEIAPFAHQPDGRDGTDMDMDKMRRDEMR